MESNYIGIIVSYFLIVLGIGYFSSRKRSNEEYLIAKRKLGVLSSAGSFIASKIGGGTIIIMVSYAYIFGPVAFMYFIGAIVGFLLLLLFSNKIREKSDSKKYYTLIDYIRGEYGSQYSFAFVFLLLLANFLNFVMQVIGGGKIIEKVFEITYTYSVLIMLGIILIYLILGGFKAVIYTDIFQLIMFSILLLIIAFFLGTIPITTPTFTSMEPTAIIGFFLIGITLPFGSHELFQRIYATKKEKVKMSLTISIIGYFTIGLLLVYLGLLIKGLLPNIEPETAIITTFTTFLTGNMKMFGIIALFSVIMSSADTWLFNTTSILLQDLFRIKKNIKKNFTIAFLAIGISSFIITIFFKNFEDIVLLYAIIYLVVGSFILYGLIFNYNKKYIPLTYIFTVILFSISLYFLGLDAKNFLVGIFIVPVSYNLSRVINFSIQTPKVRIKTSN